MEFLKKLVKMNHRKYNGNTILKNKNQDNECLMKQTQ